MSFIRFREKCEACDEEWNAAFGILGTQIIAEPPKKRPNCGSEKIKRIDWVWKDNNGNEF